MLQSSIKRYFIEVFLQFKNSEDFEQNVSIDQDEIRASVNHKQLYFKRFNELDEVYALIIKKQNSGDLDDDWDQIIDLVKTIKINLEKQQIIQPYQEKQAIEQQKHLQIIHQENLQNPQVQPIEKSLEKRLDDYNKRIQKADIQKPLTDIYFVVVCKKDIFYKFFKSQQMMEVMKNYLEPKDNKEYQFYDCQKGAQKQLLLTEEINIRDELGEWNFHPLFYEADTYLMRPNDDAEFKAILKMDQLKITDYVNKENNFQILPTRFCFLNTNEIVVCMMKQDLKGIGTGKKYFDQPKIDMEGMFINIAIENNNQPKEGLEWLQKFEKAGIKQLDSLLACPPEIYKNIGVPAFIAQEAIPKLINKLKQHGRAKKDIVLQDFEIAGLKHKIKRYFLHYSNDQPNPVYLSSESIEKGLNQVAKEYKGDKLLARLKNFYYQYAVEFKNPLKLERGMLLFGPPGTGKTVLTDKLPQMIGLTLICQPLAASEVNRSLVGQTEKLLQELCQRAEKMPHVLCCVSIDEIDTLVPKRDDKQSEHKTDTLSLLLSVIGGIKDVPNLIILASTNRLNNIDEAFRRRLSGQFFVGRPDAEIRRDMLKNNLVDDDKQPIVNDEMLNEAIKLSTNFTGAALKQLISKLRIEKNRFNNIDSNRFREIFYETSRQYKILFGVQPLALLLSDQKQNNKYLSQVEKDSDCKIYSQRILISRRDDSIIVTLEKQDKKINPQDITIPQSQSQLNDIYQFLISHSVSRNIESVQLFNMDLMNLEKAVDDTKVQEIISDKMNEINEYDKSMVIFDIDSVVGVSVSQSDSGMGISDSSSATSYQVLRAIINYSQQRTTSLNGREQWIVLLCFNKYLREQIKKGINWPQDNEDLKEQQRNEEDSKQKQCGNCNKPFQEKDNKPDSCQYHDGRPVHFIFEEEDIDITDEEEDKQEPKKILKQIQPIQHFKNLALLRVNKENQIKYLCCSKEDEQGCKHGKHQEQQTIEEYNQNLINWRIQYINILKK